jgi:hypothetical protein
MRVRRREENVPSASGVRASGLQVPCGERQPISSPILRHRGIASTTTCGWTNQWRERSETTSTFLPRSLRSRRARPIESNPELAGSTKRSTSLVSVAAFRATEPKTLTFFAP